MNGQEFHELNQVANYLVEKSRPDTTLPEGSFGQVLNGASPIVRRTIADISAAMERPRARPFAQKLSEGEVAQRLGLDPTHATAVKAQLDREYVESAVQSRMGVDQPSNEPPTMREQIAASLDAHSGE